MFFLSACTLECQQKAPHTQTSNSNFPHNKTYKTWTGIQSRTVWGHDGEAQHQTTMTFTGKSNSKDTKYMFWIPKNKHLFFLPKWQRHPWNTQRTVGSPFVNPKRKAACVLHKEDCGNRVTLEQQANNCAGRNQHDTGWATCQFPQLRAALSLCWNHSVDRRFFFIFWVLIANPVWLFGFMGSLLCRCSHSRSPTFNLGNFCYTFAPPPTRGKRLEESSYAVFV